MVLDTYIKKWLDENSRYKESVFERYKAGRILSDGEKRELEKAKAYAYGIIGVPDAEFVDSLDKDAEFAQRKQFLQPFIDGKNSEHHNSGTAYARKGEKNLDSVIHFRVTKEDKDAFFKAAGGKKLSEWITETLKKAAEI